MKEDFEGVFEIFPVGKVFGEFNGFGFESVIEWLLVS